MRLIREGNLAPDFTAVGHTGQEITLSQFRGKSAVIVYFYPRDGTPLCTKEACHCRDTYEQFVEAGAVVIGISADDPQRHRDFAQSHHLPFFLVSDEDGALRKAFDVPRKLGLLPGRITYVIDREGVVRLVFDSAFFAKRHVSEALRVLRSLP